MACAIWIPHYRKYFASEALAEHNAEIVGDKLATKKDVEDAIKGLKEDMTINMGAIVAGGIALNIALTTFVLGR